MLVFNPETKPVLDVFLGLLSFVWGACVGSFANVCIYRMPRQCSVVVPRSHCPHCVSRIAWYDNIPLLSILILRGRCRSCNGTISRRYFLVELLTGALFLIIWLRCGFDFLTPIYWLAVTALIIGTFIDFDHMIIPDQITIGGIFTGLAVSILYPSLHGVAGHFAGFRASFIGLFFGAAILWLIGEFGRVVFKKEAMGMGDVKLLGAIGAFLGWQAVVFTLMISSLAGALAGMIMVLAGNKTMGSRIPFGPYIAFAAVLWMIGGQDWWFAYLGWLRGE